MSNKVKVLTLPTGASECVVSRCEAARRYERCGMYGKACGYLEGWWPGIGFEPVTEGVTAPAAAMLLLRAGSLTALVGSAKQAGRAQVAAKDLLTRAAEAAIACNRTDLWLEAQRHLANCYRREGALDEAAVILQNALEKIGSGDEFLDLTLALVNVEWAAKKCERAQLLLSNIAAAVEKTSDRMIKAVFHHALGLIRRQQERFDEAIIEYTAACYHLEQSGHHAFLAANRTTLAFLLVRTGRVNEAHQQLNRAEALARQIGDAMNVAHAHDTRALAFSQEGRLQEAEGAARKAVEILNAGDEYGTLCDYLTTHARTLFALRRRTEAIEALLRAHAIAETYLGEERTAQVEIELLSELAGSACRRGRFTFDGAVEQFERGILKTALSETGNHQSKAALLLGMSQQALSFILKTRHREIQPPNTRGRKRKTPEAKKPADVVPLPASPRRSS